MVSPDSVSAKLTSKGLQEKRTILHTTDSGESWMPQAAVTQVKI
jgi:photosystem II stability/assembly factor-like uncharacterized protein